MREGHVQSGQVGFPLLPNKAIWVWAFYKLHSFEEDIQSGQVDFPLLLDKALTWGHEIWIWTFYKLQSFEKGIVPLGKWAVPCC